MYTLHFFMSKITLKRQSKQGRPQTPAIDLLRGRLPISPEKKPRKKSHRRKKLALIIPAHNEALLLSGTIASAINAGLSRHNIYVVDDASTDDTAAIAKRLVGARNVLTVEHSGKIGAVSKAFDYFAIQKRYVWVHITDGDGLFGPDYFRIFKKRLNAKYVAATGHLQSLKGGWVAKYRTYEYTIGLEIMRRLQHWLGVITVIPGPTSCFRTDVFAKLDFHDSSLTEDFDATLQIHRRRLGKIGFFSDAKAYTQDPRNFHDFYVQVNRWYRGFWQGVRKYRVGLHPRKIDLYVNWLIAETLLQTVQLILLVTLALISSRGPQILSFYFVLDIVMTLLWVLFAAIMNRRWDIFTALPYFYVLRFATLFIFFKAAVEVLILNKFKTVKPGWETAGRRYRIQTGQS